MFLEQLQLVDFSNWQELSVDFDPQVNIFLGQNAQGKTNLLEAIYFLALTRSHRTNKERELIRFGADYAKLHGIVQKSQVKKDLQVVLAKKGKRVWIDRLQQKKLSNYIGQLNAVLFSPEDLAIIKEGPGVRRRFMDLEFGQVNAEYLYYASKFRQILAQKNYYLKQLAKKENTDLLYLSVLSDQLASVAAEVDVRRSRYVKRLSEYAKEAYRQISGNQEELTFAYRPSGSGVKSGDSVLDIYQKLLAEYEQNQAQEIRLHTTLAGPHRDDIEFRLDGKNARFYASQGQQRTIVLSVKLAEIQLVHELTNEYPILLLDDVMSELDQKRQAALLNYIRDKTQTFITTTDLTGISQEIVENPKIYRISAGKIVAEEK